MKVRYLLLIPFFAGLLAFSLNDGTDTIKKIIGQLEKFSNEYPQEKVHLHMDKPYYAIGDNIWFKAYVVDAGKHELSLLSKILYVELINDKDSIKQSVRLPLTAGLAWGDFTLADTLKEGNYRIRAYTTWMRNFGDEYFFDKTIRIGNSVSNSVITNTNYTYSKDGTFQKVLASIDYQDLEGNPLSNKEVTYNVQLDFRNITKGKGFTDDKGNLKISFVNTQPFILKSGKISTTIKLDPKQSVTKTIPVKATSNDVDVQFFPEGGQLVNSVRSKISFKVTGAEGLGLNAAGSVYDKSGNKVTDITTEHAGMGFFGLMPGEGESYTAKLKFDDGSERSFDLPISSPTGYILAANNLDPENLNIKISINPSLINQEEVILVAHSNGLVQFIAKNIMDKPVFTASIPKSRFPTGILHLTLFSSKGEPLSERLVFISRPDQLNVKLSSKSEAAKREKVRINMEASDDAGAPVIGSFSMAVIDETKVPFKEEDETSIQSNLLLSSDIKGFVEKPNYYFSNTNENKVRHLDMLMLTQGWRRFVWKNIMADAFPALTFLPEKSMQVSGRITAVNGKPVAGGKVTLFSSSGDVFLMDTITDSDGRFRFENLYFNDNTKFVVQARSAKDRKNVNIELDALPVQMVTKNKNAAGIEINVNSSLNTYLVNSRKQFNELKRYGMANQSILLSEVKIVEKKALVQRSANLNGAGIADKVITAKDLEYATDISQYLQGRVAGIMVMNGIVYSVRSMSSSFSGAIPMQVLIDGMYVEPEFLSSINPRDVETIEVLKSASNTAIYGLRGGGGMLVITTKRGESNMAYRSYAAGILSYNPKGFYKGREFYSPNYDDPKINTKMGDMRTTIYWNPQVVTDNSGKAVVEFFNADAPGTYLAIVEGIDARGKIARSYHRYKVN